MGLFSKHGGLAKIGKKISGVAKGATNIITHPTEAIGRLINDVTGVTSSARQQIEAQKQLQTMAQDYNAEQANIERNWQTEMSNTARQRAVEDSQKAGVNPILAAGGTAAGASAGAGAAATSSTGQAGTGVGSNPISMITELINAVNNTARTNAEVKRTEAETLNIDANTTKTVTKTTKDKKVQELYNIPIVGHTLAFLNEAFGGNAGGTAVNAATSARNANKMSKAIQSPKVTTTFRR